MQCCQDIIEIDTFVFIHTNIKYKYKDMTYKYIDLWICKYIYQIWKKNMSHDPQLNMNNQ